MIEAQLIFVYQKKERERIHWITQLIRYSDWAVRILNFQLKLCLPLRSDVSSHPHQTVLLTAADWFSGEVMYFCNPMDCSLPDSSVHEIFQARILEWVAIFFSRVSSWPRDQTCVSCKGGILYHWAPREVQQQDYLAYYYMLQNSKGGS